MQSSNKEQSSTSPVQLSQPTTHTDSFTILATASIFFGLGFVIAFLLFGTGGDAGSPSEIQAAVNGTLIALTPTATPPPTAIPVNLTVADHNPTIGPANAPITIVEFSDFTCGFCGQFHRETLTPLLEHYGDMVRFVYRYFPRFDGAVPLSVAAQCANEQGKFWEYSSLLWTNQIAEQPLPFDDATLVTFAEQTALNLDQYNTCVATQNATNLVIMDYQAGRGWAVGGTPTYFINGEPFVGAQPLEVFMAFIDRKLREQGITPPARS